MCEFFFISQKKETIRGRYRVSQTLQPLVTQKATALNMPRDFYGGDFMILPLINKSAVANGENTLQTAKASGISHDKKFTAGFFGRRSSPRTGQGDGQIHLCWPRSSKRLSSCLVSWRE
jgi:hypothetical protein